MSTESAHPFSNCTHCGFCLAVCPTYQLSGDENNSPRGRLRLWSEEASGKIAADPWTDFYSAECVGCLACETACPSHVPYGELLEHTRRDHVANARTQLPMPIRLAAKAVTQPALFNLAMLPARALRHLRLPLHPHLLPGQPALWQSTAAYARQLMEERKPSGPRVALLTGCLMEALFREINFATVRVLIEHNCQVLIPETQSCCGAFHEHTGLPGRDSLHKKNKEAFLPSGAEVVLSNSSGCGYALAKSLAPELPVRDVLSFLAELGPRPVQNRFPTGRVYVDLPCHLIHGQKTSIPESVLNAMGIPWQLAPAARECCGSGGVYHLQKPENARAILASKADFLNTAEGDPVILGTSNHVCMMQWHSARAAGFVKRPYQVRHLIELLDPAPPLPPLLS
jgi:glycolate oxidase iron-sulfur subunit